MRTVYFACDDNYLYPLIFTIYTMSSSDNEGGVSIVLVCSPKEFSESSKRILNDFCAIVNVSAHVRYVEFDVEQKWMSHISASSFLTCFILTLDNLPSEFLISDVDVLYKSGWSLIWNLKKTNTEISYITVSQDRLDLDKKSTNLAIRYAHEFYFNSGVILVNNSLKPKNFDEEVVMTTIANYRKHGFEWAAQCILNFLLTRSKSELPQDFNKFVAYPKKNNNGYILHFLGGVKKPWTIPLNPFKRLLMLNTKMFPGAYWEYYITELKFFCMIARKNHTLLSEVVKLRGIGVQNAPNLSYYLKARIDKFLTQRFRNRV